MDSLQKIKQITTWLAVFLGLASSYFWYKASVAKVTEQINRHNPDIELLTRDPSSPENHIFLIATAMEQSRLNKIGAVLTALAIFCQAISTTIPSS